MQDNAEQQGKTPDRIEGVQPFRCRGGGGQTGHGRLMLAGEGVLPDNLPDLARVLMPNLEIG
ncbi:hypothetical protein GCM10007857_03890 [Bradyrhizobium iriomotense]|uniref:Uncharacterized protein n=1 Tax=Bradyrhizobium iriomotense TaxID=441950 RepID=A0ABQ6AN61_9BRAD|nr:hypothetical protein GCM10007857_03890 [Bradyrhizobium iriomotense]